MADVTQISGVASTPQPDCVGHIVMPGAFGRVDPRSIRMLGHHDHKSIIGKWTKIEMSGDNLVVEGEIHDAIYDGQQIAAQLKVAPLELSVGFLIDDADLIETDDGIFYLVINKAELREISVVTWGCAVGTSVTAEKRLTTEDQISATLKQMSSSVQGMTAQQPSLSDRIKAEADRLNSIARKYA